MVVFKYKSLYSVLFPAMVTIPNQEDQNPDTNRISDNSQVQIISEDLATTNEIEYRQLPLPFDPDIPTNDLPRLQKENKREEDGVVLINAYPHEPKLIFNDIHRFSHSGGPQHAIIQPEHTQIFQIRSQTSHVQTSDEPSWEKLKRPETLWDLLGIMSVIKNSFFGDFIDPSQSKWRNLKITITILMFSRSSTEEN